MGFPSHEFGQSTGKMVHICFMTSGTSARETQTSGAGITVRLLHSHVGSWARMTPRLASAGTVDQSMYRLSLMWLELLTVGLQEGVLQGKHLESEHSKRTR